MDKYMPPIGARIRFRIYIINIRGVDIISVQNYFTHLEVRVLQKSLNVTKP